MPSSNALRRRLESLIQSQGWTDATVQSLVAEFLDEPSDAGDALLTYLESRATSDDEQEGEEAIDPPDPAPEESIDELERQFGEVERDPDGDLFAFHAIASCPPERVWTVVSCDDGSLWCMAGKHFVNRLGYVLTPRPWITGTEQFRFDA